jgi:CheY-like chemotaxis protein
MRPLLDAALALVADGVTTLQEVDRTLGETERSTTPEDKVDERTVAPAPSAPTTLAPAKPPDSGPGEPVIDASGAASVLVVDDDPVLRQIAASLLTKEGYAVIQVEDGVAALERLNSLDPADHVDLVISDLDMPRLSGHDLLRLARGSPRTAALPIVVLTGSEDASGEARLIEDGADDYIRKPIDPARFVARVRAVLRRAGG